MELVRKLKLVDLRNGLLNEGLIQESKGYFDEKEYKRQLEFGTDK